MDKSDTPQSKLDKLAKPVKGENGEQLRQLLIKNRARHLSACASAKPKLNHLMNWQSQRLRQTYADLFSSERYNPAASYFVDELYLSANAIERDANLERVFPTMVKLLPDSVLETVAKAVELNILSAELDQQLADILFDQLQINQISVSDYTQAYQIASANDYRDRQLTLVQDIGHELDQLVRIPLLSWTLKLVRKPAHKKGLGSLHNFLETGFDTFQALGGADEFMSIILEREGKILKNLNQGHHNPFDI